MSAPYIPIPRLRPIRAAPSSASAFPGATHKEMRMMPAKAEAQKQSRTADK